MIASLRPVGVRFTGSRLNCLLLLMFVLSLAALSACASSDSVAPLTISQPLPDQESLTYTLLDRQNSKIASAQFGIQRQGDALVLTQLYTDLSGHTDNTTVTVDAATLAPRSAQHAIDSATTQTALVVTYIGGKLSAVASAGGKQRRHEAKLLAGSYDDRESPFLLRTLPFSAEFTARFGSVIVDPTTATISRALATARVLGTTTMKLGDKSFKAWEVQLSAAGRTNTAWFDSGPGRRLLRYTFGGETTIELANP